MDKKIFAVLLVGMLLVTPLASAGFGEWVSNVFSASEKKIDQPINGESGSSHSEPVSITENPIPVNDGGSSSGGSVPVRVRNVNSHRILAEGEKIYIGENGHIEMSGVNGQGSEEHCLITVLEPSQGNGSNGGAGAALIKVGELRILNRESFDLIIGVTALAQEPDYCAVVVRYNNFLETESEQPITYEEETHEGESDTPEVDR
ncbi:MAG: hypothetical protein ABIJ20_04585 [Nanoarchaeota archaeon]|nr:hypothetical protein [Nanoarchaeota archaeon]MBU1445082.1 hypothetical protein [Nanoarchaeota archaeon]MBU2406831.1 hypothetical protein [Nanoarchaeota archaeon]MBU2420337.1 hypothetical protein [Nanoarchaeota archaeon]MBU2474945.1 hypothetical protein [Nanoarchaeota archaeon]